MLRHLYLNKAGAAFVLVALFFVCIACWCVAERPFGGNNGLMLFVVILFAVMFSWVAATTPLLICDRGYGLLLVYLYKARTIFMRDITAFRYPVNHNNTLCYRIVVGTEEVLDITGKWGRLSELVADWERQNGLPDYQDEPVNTYRPTDVSFEFRPSLRSLFDRRAAFLLVCVISMLAVRLVVPPYGAVTVWIAVAIVALGGLLCKFFTCFAKDGGLLKMTNFVVRKCNHSISLEAVKWVMIVRDDVCVKLKDGHVVKVRHGLSDDDVQQLANALDSIGIPCRYRYVYERWR